MPQETAVLSVKALMGAVYFDSGKDASTVKEVLEAISFFEA